MVMKYMKYAVLHYGIRIIYIECSGITNLYELMVL